MSLFPLPLKSVLRKASRAGFDFVEVFLLGHWDGWRVDYFHAFASRLKLDLHFHQMWTTESSQAEEKRVNQVLTALGRLPPEGYNRNEWIPRSAVPLVMYAEEARDLGVVRDGVWFQAIACQKSLTDRSPRLGWVEFLRITGEKNLPLVFDTMHFIEYLRNEAGIEHSRLAAPEILDEWSRFWNIFGSQVKEFHWNDFTDRRNLWPGKGTAPLAEFARMVTESGWDGCVVPEVRPRLPLPYGARDLLALRKTTEKYFA